MIDHLPSSFTNPWNPLYSSSTESCPARSDGLTEEGPNRAIASSRFAPAISHLSYSTITRGIEKEEGSRGRWWWVQVKRSEERKEERKWLTSCRWANANTPTGTSTPQINDNRAVVFVNLKCLQTFSLCQARPRISSVLLPEWMSAGQTDHIVPWFDSRVKLYTKRECELAGIDERWGEMRK